MILTVEEFRGLVSDLDAIEDDDLATLLDAAETEIVRLAGDPATATERLTGDRRLLPLGRAADSVTSIVEDNLYGTDPITLAADDYALSPAGTVVERLSTGTNPRSFWRTGVTVVYAPRDDEALRKEVQRDLVRLTLNSNPGVTGTTVGSWAEQYSQIAASSTAERAAILARLVDGPRMFILS